MNVEQRQMLRLAAMIHERLVACSQPLDCLELPRSAWSHCTDTLRRLRCVQQRGWHLAAVRQQQYLAHEVAFLRSELSSLAAALDPAERNLPVAAAADIYRDLVSLSQEFENVDCDLKEKTLSIHTEPITLQDVELGPFEVELDIKAIPNHHCYRIIALEPLRAASNDSLTHPHVSDEQLCEGEGRMSIRRALQAGRIADFFLIVTNLLRTYNSGSPTRRWPTGLGRAAKSAARRRLRMTAAHATGAATISVRTARVRATTVEVITAPTVYLSAVTAAKTSARTV